LVKDPFALFAVEWYAGRMLARPVILVRHPAAWVSSIVKMGWEFPFSHWLQQEALIRDHLAPFADQIEEYAHSSPSLLDQAILLWNSLHHVIRSYQVEQGSWHFHRHEDLSHDPHGEFFRLYNSLGLRWTRSVQSFIRDTTSVERRLEPLTESVFDIHRDSGSATKVWRQRLSDDEVLHIRKATEGVSQWFYGDSEWE
jgi:hypothetical protein